VRALLSGPNGRSVSRISVGRTREHIIGVLGTGILGGTIVWVDIVLLCPDKSVVEIYQEAISSGMPDPEGGKCDYQKIAVRQRNRSARLGVSCREANALGDTPLEDEVTGHGNAVLSLGEGYFLIVSCSGLSDDNNELVSNFTGYGILLRLPPLKQKYSA
jgi:hypothetical protein